MHIPILLRAHPEFFFEILRKMRGALKARHIADLLDRYRAGGQIIGSLYEAIMVQILVDRHPGVGRKQLVDIIGMIIQAGRDLLVVNV